MLGAFLDEMVEFKLTSGWSLLLQASRQRFKLTKSVLECWHSQFGQLEEVREFFFCGGLLLASLLMQIMTLLFVNWAASLSLRKCGLGKLDLGVHRVLSVVSASDRSGEKR